MRRKWFRIAGRVAVLAISFAVFASFAREDDASTSSLLSHPEEFSYLDYMSERLQRVHEQFELGNFDPHLGRLTAEVDSLRALELENSPSCLDRVDLLLLGSLKADRGAPDWLVETAQRSLRQRRNLVGGKDVRLALPLYNLAAAYTTAGRPLEGLPHIWESLEIRLSQEKPSRIAIGVSWMGLGNVFYLQGMKAAALRAWEQSIAVQAQESGAREIYGLYARTNSAFACRDLGLFERALTTLEEVNRKFPGLGVTSNTRTAESLQRLAELRIAAGDWEGVEGSLAEVQRLLEGLDEEDRVIGAINHNLSTTHALLRGELAEAREHAEAALRLMAEISTIPWQHPALFDALAAVELAAGDLDAARRSLESASFAGLDEVPATIRAWNSYLRSVLARLEGNPEVAVDEALASSSVTREAAVAEAVLLRDLEAYVESERRMAPLSAAISELLDHPRLLQERIRDVWAAVADSRALTTRVLRSRRRSLRQDSDPLVASLLDAATALRLEGARVAMTVEHEDSGRDYLERIREQLQKLESGALVQGMVLGDRRANQNVDLAIDLALDDWFNSMPVESALVSIVRFERTVNQTLSTSEWSPRRRTWRGNEVGSFADPVLVLPSYAAFVRSPCSSRVDIVDLGPAGPIERAIARWRSELASLPTDSERSEYASGRHSYEAQGRELRQLLWDPLAPRIRDAESVLLIPDGEVHFLNFDAFQTEDGRFLAETAIPIQYLSSESALRELVRDASPHPKRSILVVAGPNFGPDLGTVAPEVDPRAQRDMVMRSTGLTSLRAAVFQHLPAAAREGERIAQLWEEQTGDPGSIRLLTGRNALESAVRKEAPGHSILHFATHAFVQVGRAAGGSDPWFNASISSGIALAGASTASGPPANDGLLFAEEISHLDLSHTEWVVLSACETGLGDVRVGEGVLGLRDALEQAGARTLILSLWKVMDSETQKWMLELYEARLSGLNTPESVRAANLARLSARRAAGQDVHPRYWGAFIATGHWR